MPPSGIGALAAGEYRHEEIDLWQNRTKQPRDAIADGFVEQLQQAILHERGGSSSAAATSAACDSSRPSLQSHLRFYDHQRG